MTRTDIINHLIKSRSYKSYLEIGVQQGVNFEGVECDKKLGVDPDIKSTAQICLTSDQFFEDNKIIGRTFDIVFVDGWHISEQALKDIDNAAKILNPGGIIVVHDASPQEEQHQLRELQPGTWNGDVWKAIAWLNAYGTKLETVDADFGCALITPPIPKWLVSPSDQSITAIEPDLSMEWEDLVENRQAFLNLITVDQFKEKYV